MFNLQGNSHPQGTLSGKADSFDVPKHYPWSWWQQDYSMNTNGGIESNPTLEACIATISETVAMLPIKHFKEDAEGGKVLQKNSSVARVMRRPNEYQTKSEFLVGLVRQTLLEGNGYAVAERNGRFEVSKLYPTNRMSVYVSKENKDAYYSGGTTELVDLNTMIPSRDVLHFRLHTNGHPLIGVSPLVASLLAVDTGNHIQGHVNALFRNRATPNAVFSTPMTLSADQVKELKSRANESLQGLNSGGVMVLTSDMKFQQVTMSSVDSELIATDKMADEKIARAFRIPMAMVGIMDKASFANTETLMKYWVANGLGFVLEHLENSLEKLFDLPYNESIEFDTEFILQADFKSRMDGYKVGVTGGFFTPNEIRALEQLKPLDGGDELYMQTQNTPIAKNTARLDAEIERLQQEVKCGEDCGKGEAEEPKVDVEAEQMKAQLELITKKLDEKPKEVEVIKEVEVDVVKVVEKEMDIESIEMMVEI